MWYSLAATAVLAAHFGFIAFALLGGLLAFHRRWMVALHLPAAAWGLFVEISGRICPLTDLENTLRVKAGESGYADSFVEHYLLAIIYPHGLTRAVQFWLAAVVLLVNAAIYASVFRRFRR